MDVDQFLMQELLAKLDLKQHRLSLCSNNWNSNWKNIMGFRNMPGKVRKLARLISHGLPVAYRLVNPIKVSPLCLQYILCVVVGQTMKILD